MDEKNKEKIVKEVFERLLTFLLLPILCVMLMIVVLYGGIKKLGKILIETGENLTQ